MLLAVTGHRPDKLGGYGLDAQQRLVGVALKALKQLRPTEVITGMALGWDQAIAEACIDLGIPFCAAVPFPGQASRWPEASKVHYQRLLNSAVNIMIVDPGPYTPAVMHKRNHWMVDNADSVLALWNGDTSGGTYECVQYARKQDKRIYNAWNVFRRIDDLINLQTFPEE